MTGTSRWFPVGPPLTEDQQIGRRSFIDGLERRCEDAEKVKLFAPRRSGKTSCARTVIERFAVRDRPAAHVDLSRLGGPDAAGRALVEQLAPGLARLLDARRAAGWLARIAGTVLDGEAGRATATVADDLAVTGVSPGSVLERCAAGLADRPAAILLDEAHHLASWPAADQRTLREALRNDLGLGVIIASSEQHALDELTRSGGPLEYVGTRLPLPPIERGDWEAELPRRFESVGAPIDPDALGLLLDESRCHPYCTMLLSRESAHLAVPVGRSTIAAVRAGLQTAVSDEAWQLRDG